MTPLSSPPLSRTSAQDGPEPAARRPSVAAPAAGPDQAVSFQASLATAADHGAAGPATVDPAGGISKVYRGSRSGELTPVQKFEGFVLRSFVESMLPSDNSSFFGTGTAGKIWKSMLAERIGDEMAGAGGIGIADMLAKRGDKAVAVEGAVNDLATEDKLAVSAAAVAEPADAP